MSAPDDARGPMSTEDAHQLLRDLFDESIAARVNSEVETLRRDLTTLRERYEVLRDMHVYTINNMPDQYGNIEPGSWTGEDVEGDIDTELARRREAAK